MHSSSRHEDGRRLRPPFGATSDHLLELDQVAPRFQIVTGGFDRVRAASQDGRDRQGFVDLPAFELEASRRLLDRKPAEPALRGSAGRLGFETFSVDPGQHPPGRCAEKSRDARRRQPSEVPSMFSRSRRDLEEEATTGRDELHRLAHESIARRLGEPDRVAERQDTIEDVRPEGRLRGVAPDPHGKRSRDRSRGPVLGDRPQHLHREIEGDRGPGSARRPGSEPSGSGAEIEPSKRPSGPSVEEAFSDLAPETTLSRSFVPGPFSVDPVAIGPPEPLRGRARGSSRPIRATERGRCGRTRGSPRRHSGTPPHHFRRIEARRYSVPAPRRGNPHRVPLRVGSLSRTGYDGLPSAAEPNTPLRGRSPWVRSPLPRSRERGAGKEPPRTERRTGRRTVGPSRPRSGNSRT